ncbi:hypothetical protein FB45DRAFT_46212 [Roridomyces roridus]|uniref:Uncharacterized protein n=1 Tax=Roridomyces roridus TaxID=1738132 RepID=A0AAD7BRW4_9AGAR|nr:hypothetical protein FB45DRAFT_46212 [Roridomyces roridus]
MSSSNKSSFRSRIARRTSTGLSNSRPATPTDGARSSSVERWTSTPPPTLPAIPPIAATKDSPNKSLRTRLRGVMRRNSATSIDESESQPSEATPDPSEEPTRKKSLRARMGTVMRRTSSIVSDNATRPATPPPATTSEEGRRSSLSLSSEARKSTASLIPVPVSVSTPTPVPVLASTPAPAAPETPPAPPEVQVSPIPDPVPAPITSALPKPSSPPPSPLTNGHTHAHGDRRSVKRLLPVAQYPQMRPSPIAESPLREAEAQVARVDVGEAIVEEESEQVPVTTPELEPAAAQEHDEYETEQEHEHGEVDVKSPLLILIEAQTQMQPSPVAEVSREPDELPAPSGEEEQATPVLGPAVVVEEHIPPVLESEPEVTILTPLAPAAELPPPEPQVHEEEIPPLVLDSTFTKEPEEMVVPDSSATRTLNSIPDVLPPAAVIPPRVVPSSSSTDDDAYFVIVLGHPQTEPGHRAAVRDEHLDDREEMGHDLETDARPASEHEEEDQAPQPKRASTAGSSGSRSAVRTPEPTAVDPLLSSAAVPVPSPPLLPAAVPEQSTSVPSTSQPAANGRGQRPPPEKPQPTPSQYPPQNPLRKEDDPMWVLSALVAFVTDILGRFWHYYS